MVPLLVAAIVPEYELLVTAPPSNPMLRITAAPPVRANKAWKSLLGRLTMRPLMLWPRPSRVPLKAVPMIGDDVDELAVPMGANPAPEFHVEVGEASMLPPRA